MKPLFEVAWAVETGGAAGGGLIYGSTNCVVGVAGAGQLSNECCMVRWSSDGVRLWRVVSWRRVRERGQGSHHLNTCRVF